jgi:uncharacterized protein (TIGR04255 family)
MKVRKRARAMRKDNLPRFANPPVVETILGVQFDEIPNLTSAHFGWYWREYLDKSWGRTQEAPPLPDQFENFGDQSRKFPFPNLTAKIATSFPARIQFINEYDDRVIQIQNTRFLYNWRKRESVYPTFQGLYPDFLSQLSSFRNFLKAASLADLTPNQWEVTYVNHIESGVLWMTPDDWHSVLPGIIPPPRTVANTKLEREFGEITFEVVQERGRLHVQLASGRSTESGRDMLALSLTARGPIKVGDPALSLESGIELGHNVLVETFVGMASDKVLSLWGKRDS